MESLLAVTLFGLLVSALIGTLFQGRQSTVISGAHDRALLYAAEGLEGVRNIRDEDFTLLADGTHGLQIQNNQWELSGSSDTSDIFTRSTTITPVSTTTKRVTTEVWWQATAQRSASILLETLLTNWMLPITIGGDWSVPVEIASIDLDTGADGWKIDIQDSYAYIVRTNANPDFLVVDISSPVAPAVVGSLNLPGIPRNISVAGDYAFVASDDNSAEFQIVRISSPLNPVFVGSSDFSQNADAQGVFAIGNMVYTVTSPRNSGEFFIMDTTVPTAPLPVGSLDLGKDHNNEVVVLGSTAYIASADKNEELKVVDITIAALPNQIGLYNLEGNNTGTTIAGFGSTVVMGSSKGELYIFDVSTPAVPVLLGIYDAGDDIRDVSIGNNDRYAFLATDENNSEFQVVNISAPTNPFLVGLFDVPGNNDLNGVAYSDQDYAFAVGENNDGEFVIFGPQ